MKKKIIYFLILPFLVLAFSQLFIFSSELSSDDELFHQQFNIKYGIFAILQPKGLAFSGEEIPINSPEIWERIDRELLKNTYLLS